MEMIFLSWKYTFLQHSGYKIHYIKLKSAKLNLIYILINIFCISFINTWAYVHTHATSKVPENEDEIFSSHMPILKG